MADASDRFCDNDYIVKLNPAAFGLLHDLAEEEVSKARATHAATLEVQELWLALKRADAEHECVDEGYRLKL